MDIYQILDITRENADDLELLKQNYRQKLLECHPDKNVSSITIDMVKNAFNILSDPIKRQRYDKVVLRAPVSVSEIIDLDDMEEKQDKWTKSCRCGEDEGYIVTEQDLEENGSAEEINLQCIGCSIWIKVQYAIE